MILSDDPSRPVRRYFEEVHNQRAYAVMDEIFGSAWDLVGYKQFLVALHQAFPDLQFTIDDQIIAGDKVVTRWTWQGHHQGTYASPLGSIAATGRAVSGTGITIDRIEGQRIIDRWFEADTLGLLQQMDVFANLQLE
jgi:predicted ester cyclase